MMSLLEGLKGDGAARRRAALDDLFPGDQQREVVRQGQRKHQAIQPIQEPAMSGDQAARVLDLRLALEERDGEIAEGIRHGDQQAEQPGPATS